MSRNEYQGRSQRREGGSAPLPMLSIGAPTCIGNFGMVKRRKKEKREKKRKREERRKKKMSPLLVQVLAPPMINMVTHVAEPLCNYRIVQGSNCKLKFPVDLGLK